jgi:peptidyl-prolyl cis-trans isomerase B (cyclophilin B)
MSNPQVELHIADHGVITIELDADKAPKSTENFLAYVNKGHYNNTIFHRIIDGFMIQGGGFEPGMKQKDTDAPIENEAKNGLKNDKFTLAMARTGQCHGVNLLNKSHNFQLKKRGVTVQNNKNRLQTPPHQK